MNTKALFLLVISLCAVPYALGQSRSIKDIRIRGNYHEERRIEINVTLNEKSEYSVIKELKPYYSIPKTDVLSNGYLILVHSLEGVVEVYDTNGEIIFQDEYYKLPPYRGQSIKHDIWSQGFLVVSSEQNVNTLYKITNDGNTILSLELEEGMISGIKLSGNGEFFAYSAVEWINDELYYSTTLLSLNGQYYQSIPIHFENGVFSTESNIFVGWGKRNTFCVDIDKANLIWEKRVKSYQLISEAMIDAKDTYILISNNPVLIENKWEYDNIEIISKNRLGDEKKVFQNDLTATDVRFKTPGKERVLILDDKEYKFTEN